MEDLKEEKDERNLQDDSKENNTIAEIFILMVQLGMN